MKDNKTEKEFVEKEEFIGQIDSICRSLTDITNRLTELGVYVHGSQWSLQTSTGSLDARLGALYAYLGLCSRKTGAEQWAVKAEKKPENMV